MKNKKSLLVAAAGICIASILASCPPVVESPGESNQLIVPDVKFIEDGKYENKGYTSIVFAQGTKLKTIGKNAFKGNKITGLTLPPSVTTIAEGAFEGNVIEELDLPEALAKVGKNAFKGNKLKKVVFKGNKITELGKDAFADQKGVSTKLPTFKVSAESVMKLIFSKFTATDSSSKKVPPTVETADKEKLSPKTISNYVKLVEKDTKAPSVKTVALEGSDKIYETDDKIKVAVTFDEAVYVTGTPHITLRINAANKRASYNRALSEAVSGADIGRKLMFTYTVLESDHDEVGIEIQENKLSTGEEGTIRDKAGNSAGLNHAALAVSGNHKVNVKEKKKEKKPVNPPGVVKEKEKKPVNPPVVVKEKEKKPVNPPVVVKEKEEKKPVNPPVVVKEKEKKPVNPPVVVKEKEKKPVNPPTIKGVRWINLPPTKSGRRLPYKIGDRITVEVSFYRSVSVPGSAIPYIVLRIDGKTKRMSMVARKPEDDKTKLIFAYQVQDGDDDDDGISIGSVLGHSSSIRNSAGTMEEGKASYEGHGITTHTDYKVDATRPKVVETTTTQLKGTPVLYKNLGLYLLLPEYKEIPRSKIPIYRILREKATVSVKVTFDETVRVDDTSYLGKNKGCQGQPYIALTGNFKACYASGLLKTLNFVYTVKENHNKYDGISVGIDAISHAASIKDLAGNSAVIPTDDDYEKISDYYDAVELTTTTTGQRYRNRLNYIIETSQPNPPLIKVENISIKNKERSASKHFGREEYIEVWLRFTDKLKAVGEDAESKPYFVLKMGEVDKKTYYSTSIERKGKSIWIFGTDTVHDSSNSLGVISFKADALNANGFAIKDIAGRNINLKVTPRETSKSVVVRPKVSGRPTVESSPTSNNRYTMGDKIKVAVTFNEAVNVTGAPQIALKIGRKSKYAIYERELSEALSKPDRGRKLIFEYTVESDDNAPGGISIPENALEIKPDSGASIKNTAKIDASLDHKKMAIVKTHKIVRVPTITSVQILQIDEDGSIYSENDEISVKVSFNEKVRVDTSRDNNNIYIRLRIGANIVKAIYRSGSSRKRLIFKYTVKLDDNAPGGISIPQDALVIKPDSGASIKNLARNIDVRLNHAAVVIQAGHKVQTSLP